MTKAPREQVGPFVPGALLPAAAQANGRLEQLVEHLRGTLGRHPTAHVLLRLSDPRVSDLVSNLARRACAVQNQVALRQGDPLGDGCARGHAAEYESGS